MGNWKLVERADAPKFEIVGDNRKAAQTARRREAAPKKDELFNLHDDPAEETNVADKNAERVLAMKKRLVEARDRGFTRPGAGQ
jgi:hypothetical protein